MGETTHRLDDRYTDGIWYDTYNGDFAQIQKSGDGELVELVNPETGDVYWDMPVSDWKQERHMFDPVPEDAVADPKDFIMEMIALAETGDTLSERGQIGLRYAREQVEITEQ